MATYRQDFDSRTLKQKGISILKNDYIITSIHTIAGELLLKHYMDQVKRESNNEDKFLLMKELERRVENKANEIGDSEEDLNELAAGTHLNFKNYINSLNLPSNVCSNQFEFLNRERKVDLVYLYNPDLKGSSIIRQEEYEIIQKQNNYD